jgi:hypothetical protein
MFMVWTKANATALAGTAFILAMGTSLIGCKEQHRTATVHLPDGTLPRTPAEVDAWYIEPPAGQNAATFNLQGIKAMKTEGADQIADLPILGKLPPPDPSAPLPPSVKSALAAFMQRNHKALQSFVQGAKFEQSRYPLDLTKGSDTLLPHLQGIKRGMQLTEMSAVLNAENNEGKKAADDVLLTLALAHSLTAEPVTISQLVRVAGVSLAVDALNQVVNRTTLPPETCRELSKAFQNMEDFDARGEGFTRAVIGEKVNHLSQLENRDKLIRDLTAPQPRNMTEEQHRLVQYLKQTPGLQEEQDYLETASRQFLDIRQEAFPDRLKDATDLIHRNVTEARNRGLRINEMYWDGYDKTISREARSLANLRLALTALALEQFRAAHGNRYPSALSELTPEYLAAAPVDPFDGKPLRYHTQGAGYMLYSIGPDLKDDGGARTDKKGGDLVFDVASPPAS